MATIKEQYALLSSATAMSQRGLLALDVDDIVRDAIDALDEAKDRAG